MPILDYHHKILCQDVWSSDEMILRAKVRESLQSQLHARFPNARGLLVVGDLVGHYYNDTSDLDLLVVAKDEDLKTYLEESGFVSGYLLENTQHRVNFHVVDAATSPSSVAARFGPVYDTLSNVWYGRRVTDASEMTRPEAIMEHISWRLYKVKGSSTLQPYKWDILDEAFHRIAEEDQKRVIYNLRLTVANLDKNIRNVVKAFNKAEVWKSAASFALALEDRTASEDDVAEYAKSLGLPDQVVAAIVNKYRYSEVLDSLETLHAKQLKQQHAEEEAEYASMRTSSVVSGPMLDRLTQVVDSLVTSGGGTVSAVHAMSDAFAHVLRNSGYVATDTRRKMVIKLLTDALFPSGMGRRSKMKEPEDEQPED